MDGLKRRGVMDKSGNLLRSKWTKIHNVSSGPNRQKSSNKLEPLTDGLPIYIKDPVQGWTRAVVIGTNGQHVHVETLKGQFMQVVQQDVMLRSTEGDLVKITNLTQVIPVNEATVLDCLHQRFTKDVFYTQAGSTIVAVNPCKNVEYFYTPVVIRKYKTRCNELPPHIFQLASAAYCDLVRGRGKVNQSLVVSGESGAGKTVSAKHLLRYLTIVSSPDQNLMLKESISGTAVERRVLESNPILEAFGNAATSRNENSSRFGKFIQLLFDRTGRIKGGIIKTYLLEKTRVIHPGQANFHIFYQLSAIQSETDIPLWLDGVRQEVISASSICLVPNSEETPDSSGCETPQTSSITRTVRSMEDIGVTSQDQVSIFKILLAILHLSHIKFRVTRDCDKCMFGESEDSLWSMSESCRLLGVSDQNLQSVLLSRRIVSGNQERRISVFIKAVGEAEARSRRDCLAMLIYASLFEWLVSFINTQIKSDKFDYNINLLDIYGFESLGENSLEQLCINYANERLQQHYVAGCLRDMQMEYEAENIPWVNIDYHDNRPCVEALHAPSSIFGVLNEEVCLNRLSEDKDLCDRLIASDSTRALVSRTLGAPCSEFMVTHYAGPVTYTVDGVVDKNRDAIPPELVELLAASDNTFLSGLLNTEVMSVAMHSATPSKTMKKKTVLTKFKSSLDHLMASISQTDVHYIRCVKPNARNIPNFFDRPFVIHQLKACGTIETVDICCHGYPARMNYTEFSDRYQVLVKCSDQKSVLLDRQQQIKQSDLNFNVEFLSQVEEHITCLHTKRHEDKYKPSAQQLHAAKSCAMILARTFPQDELKPLLNQFGLYKLFLSQSQLENLEKCRESCIAKTATLLQSAWRAKYQRCQFLIIKKAAVRIQCQWKAFCQHQLYRTIKKAAIAIQTHWRMYQQRLYFNSFKIAVTVIQKHFRLYRQRLHFCTVKAAAVIIQRKWRAHCQQKTYTKIRSSTVIIQKNWRAFKLKRHFISLRASAVVLQRKWKDRRDRLKCRTLKSGVKKIKDSIDSSDALNSESFHKLKFAHQFKVNYDIADDSDNESWMSDDSGVMVKGEGLNASKKESDMNQSDNDASQALNSPGTKSFRMGDGVITCRRLTKICSHGRKGGRQIMNRICKSGEVIYLSEDWRQYPGFRFHVRPNRLLPFAHVVHASLLPQGLVDALTWETHANIHWWTHAMADTLIGMQGWTHRLIKK